MEFSSCLSKIFLRSAVVKYVKSQQNADEFESSVVSSRVTQYGHVVGYSVG